MQRTQGTPTKQKFDVDTGNFEFKFTFDKNVTSPSIGFFSQEFFYEDGITATYYSELEDMSTDVLPADDYTATYADNMLTFMITNEALHNQTIKVNVIK